MPIGFFLKDHPRLCGEKSCTSSRVRSGTGSPPPMRGKEGLLCGFDPKNRITPAYAGKRYCYHGRLYKWWDHPRLCGEKFLSALWKIFLTGSPPPMRGKGGKVPECGHRRQDHPRLCGEKFNCFTKFCRRLGSPPPMRGKGRIVLCKKVRCGITPAYAGKSHIFSLHF